MLACLRLRCRSAQACVDRAVRGDGATMARRKVHFRRAADTPRGVTSIETGQ